MGVRGLLSFVQGQCPDALEHVDLRRLADQHYRRYKSKPQLLIDCNGYIRDIYGRLEFALGGQWMQHVEHVKVFVDYFQRAGFELIVMFDGVVEKKKINKWIDRRKNERKTVSKIFDDMKHSGRHPDHRLFHIPASLSTLTRLALKGLGVTVCNSSIEVDRELFYHYKRHQSFGIVSRDTDFMIYDVPQVFIISCTNGYIRDVKLFRRDILCHHLGLPPQQLPLLACLLGCDTVSPSMLWNFHKRVTRGKRDPLVPSVAGYIRSLQLRDLSKATLNSIAYDIGRDFQNGFLYECVQDYACDHDERNAVPPLHGAGVPRAPVELTASSKINQSVMDKIRLFHKNLDINDFVLQAVMLQEFRSNMTLDDDSDGSMPSSGLVYRPIRQRLYGILLQPHVITQGVDSSSCGSVNAEGKPIQFGDVEELCAYAGNPMRTPDVVRGMPLDIPVQPRLEDLWVDDTTSPDVQRLRLQVFFSCMHSTRLLEEGIMDVIPHRYILLCCVLHFLLLHAPETTLRSCEVDAFIAQVLCLQDHSPRSLEKLKVSRVSARGVHLAAIFVRGLTAGYFTNSTCCLPFPMESLMPWYIFDGKLFHLKYLAAEGGSTPQQLCEDKPHAVEMFHKIKDYIVRGTRFGSS